MGFIVNCKENTSNYWNRTDSTIAYFDDIRQYKILSPEEEQKLIEMVKNGDDRERNIAREKLIIHNQRFIASIVRRFTNGKNFLDLINEANIGLMTAIDKYDVSYKGRFLTYAVFWIRKYINDFLIQKDRSIQPVNAHKVYAYANKGREAFFNKFEHYPSDEELLVFLNEEYGVVLSNKNDLSQYVVNSIDSPIDPHGDDNGEFAKSDEFNQATSSNNIHDDIIRADNINIIRFLLDKLPDRNQKIITSFYGIECEAQSLEAISKKINLSKERVRQILTDSIKTLKKININKL